MSAFNWACWIWKDEKNVVRYVGYGPYDHGHPAAVKWASRHDDDSELHLWLQDHRQIEPTREVCGAAIMEKKMAFALATVFRDRYKDTILESRGPMSYNGGGKRRGVIYFPDDGMCSISIFSSVREAGKMTGINPSNITRKCRNVKNHEWHYADSSELV